MKAKYADIGRLEQLIRRLAPVYGPSGREELVRKEIIDIVKPLADEVSVDAMGNVIALLRGTGGDGARRVMVSTHMDEIGLIVTHIDDDGFLRFAPIGGIGPATLIGQQVVFEDGTVGSVGTEKMDGPKDIQMDKMFIDIGATEQRRGGEIRSRRFVRCLHAGRCPLGLCAHSAKRWTTGSAASSPSKRCIN